MKKQITAICTGLLGVFLLTGCGKTSDNTCCDAPLKKSITTFDEISQPIPEPKPKLEPKSIVPKPPVIVLEDFFTTNACKRVEINATGSFDPDGDSEDGLKYLWSDIDGNKVSEKPAFTRYYDHRQVDELTLKLTDEQNLTSTKRVCVLVGIDETQIPLIAKVDGKLDISSNQESNLEARAVCKHNDEIKEFVWKESDTILSTDMTLKRVFEKGKHLLTLYIEDINGNRTSTQIVLNVK